MTTKKVMPNHSRKHRRETLFIRADHEWNRGNLRPAFRLFLQAAKNGDRASQLNVGYFYDKGLGTRRDLTAALYWYKRAYRSGDASAANNIGTTWRDQRNAKRALTWFQRAVRLGDHGANLEIAKLFLREDREASKATACLKKVIDSDCVSESEIQEARELLGRAKRRRTERS
jgi:TPR repeat protein